MGTFDRVARTHSLRGWIALLLSGALMTAGVLAAPIVAPQLALPQAQAATVSSANGDLTFTYNASTTSLPAGGGSVTYTYTVKNNSGVIYYYGSLSDSNCTAISGSTGSISPGSTATFKCTTTVTQSTLSTANVSYYYYDAWYQRQYQTASATQYVTVASGTTPTPITCAVPKVWVSSGSTTQLYQQYQGANGSTFTKIGNNTTWGYNALAYNTKDGYLYAISNTPNAGDLLRIDANGNITDLGQIGSTGWTYLANGTTTAATTKTNWLADIGSGTGGGINTGVIDPATGLYYVSNASTSGSGYVYVIDLVNKTIKQLSTTAFVTNDFTIKDGYLWGIQNGTTTMLRMSLSTGVVSSFSLASLGIPATTYGAAWTYGNGNLGFDDNSGSGYYQIQVTNPTTSTPTFTLVYRGSAPSSNNNDGASCSGTNNADLSVTKLADPQVYVGTQVTFTLRIQNNGSAASSGGVVKDTVPTGYTNIQIASAFTTAPAGGSPACTLTGSQIQCITGQLNPGDYYDITFTATAPSTAQCLTNTATVTGNEFDPVAANNTGSEQTCTTTAQIDVAKTAGTTALSGPDANGVYTATYTITVKNTGTVSATYTQVTDSPLFTAGTSIQSVSWSGGPTKAGPTPVATANADGSYNIGSATTKTLAAGATDTYQVTVTYTQTPSATTPLTLCGTPSQPGMGLFNGASVPQETGSTSNNAACLNPAPMMTVTKTVTQGTAGPGTTDNLSVQPGVPVDYWYQVSNPVGAAEALAAPTLTDDRCTAPALQSGDANGNGRVDPGETWLYKCTQTFSTGGDVTNKVTANSTGATTNQPVTATDTATVTVLQPNINVVKTGGTIGTQNPDGTVTVTYTVQVINSGLGNGSYGALVDTPQFAPNLEVRGATWTATGGTDPAPSTNGGAATGPGPYTLSTGSAITHGVTHTYNVQITFAYTNQTQAAACAGPNTGLYNAVTLAGEQGPTADNATCVEAPAPPAPALVLAKSAGTPTDTNGNGVVDPGDTIVYTFSVTNTGTITLAPVTVTDAKLGLTNYACVPSLSPGQTLTCASPAYTITADDQQAGAVTNTATATGTTSTGTATSGPSTATVPVASPASLNISKSVGAVSVVDPATGTFTVHYSVRVENTGGTPTTFGALTDTPAIDPAFRVAGYEWTGDAKGSCVGTTCPATFTIAPTGTPIGAGQTLTYDVVLTIAYASTNAPAACAGPGTGLYNSVALPGGQELGTTADNAACAAPPAPLTNGIDLVKSAGALTDADGSGTATAGDTIVYSFIVTNTGTSQLTNVTVTDPKVGAVTCLVTTLAPGATTTCSAATYVLTQADVDAGAVNNTATATGTPPLGTPPTDASSTSTPLDQGPAITLDKQGTVNDVNGNGRTDLGDTVTYRFVVTNTGNTTLTNIAVADPKLAGLTITCPATTLAPYATTTCTASGPYAITPADSAAQTVTNTAQVTSTAPGGAQVTNTDTNAVPVVAPAMTLTKSVTSNVDTNGNGRTDAGDVLTYSFVVTNTGNTSLTAVAVSDPRVGPVTCPQSSLAAGAAMTCSATYTVTAADATAGSIVNTASATAQPPTGTPLTSTATVTTPTQSASLTLDKSHQTPTDVNGNGRTDAGDTVVYTFVVTNTGNTSLSNLRITDPKLAGGGATITCAATTLAPGASTTCASTAYTITAADATTGSVNNTATVTGTPATGTDVTAADADTLAVQRASITLDKTHTAPADTNGNGRVDAGDVIAYSFLVTNTGNVTLSNVVVSDAKVGAVSCPSTTLAAGASMTCTANYTITATDAAAGVVNNTATVSAAPPAGTAVTATDTDTQAAVAPAFTLDKQLATWNDVNVNGRADAGDTLVYRFVVTNTGNTILSGLAVTDPRVGAVTCPVTTLGVGVTTTCTAGAYTITADDVTAGNVVNTATASVLPPTGTALTATDSVTQPTQSAGITLLKRHETPVDTNGNGRIDAGDSVTYLFDVTNTGTTILNNVVVSDPKVGTVTCPATSLAPGGTFTCTATYVIQSAEIADNAVNNTATVTAQPVNPDGTPAGTQVTATATDNIPTVTASVDIVKAISGVTDTNINGRTDAGDVIRYSFTVTNTGLATLSPVQVSDPLVTDLACPATSLAQGATMTCMASYTVLDTDVTAGAVSNTATATGQPLDAAGNPAGTPVTDASTAVQPTASASISLDKRNTTIDDLNADGRVDVGDRIHYEFVVTNTGTLTLTNVAIADPKILDVVCPSTTLAPGASMTCTGSKLISQLSSETGAAVNTASVSAQPVSPDGTSGGDPVHATDTNSVPTQHALIKLDKRIASVTDINGDGRTDAGDQIYYVFDITNAGNVTLNPVSITDPLLTNAGATISCASTTLAPGETTACTATPYTVTAADVATGVVANDATAVGQPVNPDGTTAGTPVTATDTDTQNLTSAVINLTKAVGQIDDTNLSGRVDPGDVIHYQLTVSNDGATQLTNVRVTDPMIANVDCPAVALDPGTSMVCTGTHVVTEADVADLAVDNTASAIGTPPTGNDVTDTDTATVPASNAQITVDKTTQRIVDVNGNGRTDAGDQLYFQFVVTNTGNLTVTSVSVTDSKIGGAISCPTTPLAPGESLTCLATQPKTITQASADLGQVVNTATAHAQPLNPDGTVAGELLSAQDTNVTPTQSASVLLDKTIAEITDTNGDGRPDVGDTIVYSLAITNTGQLPLGSVTLSDPELPAALLQTATCSPIGATVVTGTSPALLINGAMSPGDSTTCIVRVTIDGVNVGAVPTVDNTATVTGQPLNPDGTNAGATVTSVDTAVTTIAKPAITLTKTAGTPVDVNADGRTDVGDTIAYTFVVTNTGNTVLADIVLDDPKIGAVNCPTTQLDPQGTMTCTSTVPYTITAADVPGGVVNTATVTGTPIWNGTASQPVTAMAGSQTPVQTASIDVTKDAQITDTNNTGRLGAGDTAVFVFTVTNTGTLTLNNVTLTDADPEALPITCIDPVTGAAVPNGQLTLQPGATATCQMQPITISAADASDAVLHNVVVASGTPTQGTAVTDTAEATKQLQDAHISLQKTIAGTVDTNANGRVDATDVIRYQFVVTNTGTMAIGGITLADAMVGNLSCPTTYLLPGASTTCTGTHTITADEAATGAVPNNATVTGQPLDGTGNAVGNPVTANSEAIQPTQVAGIALEKSAGPVQDLDGKGTGAGDRVTYTFTVTNTGTVDLHNVTIDDKRLNLTGYLCVAGPLAPGASASCTADYVLTQADVDSTQVVNVATATGIPTIGTAVTSQDTVTTDVPGTPALGLVKTASAVQDTNADGRQDAGDTILYSFTVTNTGTVTLTDVVIDDELLNLTDFVCAAELAPGATTVCNAPARYTLTQADADAGLVANNANADASSSAGPPPTALDATTTPIVASTAITLTKTAGAVTDVNGNGRTDAGDTIAYSFTVNNASTVSLSHIVISDAKLGLNGWVCTEGPLAPGASATCAAPAPYKLTLADLDAGRVDNTAITTGTAPDGSTISSIPATATVPLTGEPGIVLDKTAGSPTVAGGLNATFTDAGDTVVYTFSIRNTGNVTLSDVTVSDPRLGINGLVCGKTTLVPGETVTCSSPAYELTQADLDAGQVTNTATASGTGALGGTVTDDGVALVSIAPVPAISLDKQAGALDDVDGNGADTGDTILYRFVVTNTGNVSLATVTVTDPMVGEVNCPQADLLPGGSMVCTAAAYVLTQADVDAGRVVNTASATGTPPAGTPPTATDNVSVLLPVVSSFSLLKQAATPTVEMGRDATVTDAGDTIAYTFTVTNTGSTTLTNLVVTDDRVGAVACDVTTLLPTESVVCTAAAYVLTQADVDAGQVTNLASATMSSPGGPLPPQTSSTVTPIGALPLIGLAKSVTPGTYDAPNQALTYTFVITNTGNVTLDNVNLTDPMLGLNGTTCGNVTVLAPGESTTCTSTYRTTQADVDAISLVNTATAAATPPASPDPVQAQAQAEAIPTQNAAITLDKQASAVADANGNGRADAGEQISYTFLVTNTGNVTLTKVDVTDNLLGAVTCPTTTLAPGASVTCTAAPYTLTQADVDTGNVPNTATVLAAPPAGDYPTATDSVVVPLPAQPGIALDKKITSRVDDGDNRDSAGDKTYYSFTVTNTGNVTLSIVTITDPLLDLTAAPCADTLAPGEVVTCVIPAMRYTTQADVDAGSVTNTATATGNAPDGNRPTSNDSVTITFTPRPGLEMVKSAHPSDTNLNGIIDAGDRIEYWFSLRNPGNVTVSLIDVQDQVLATAGVYIDCPVRSLAPGATAQCTSLPYTITQADQDAGSVNNVATASGTPANGGSLITPPSAATVPLTAADPQLTLVKSVVDAGGDGRAQVGEQLTYTFLVSNTGNVQINDLRIDDPRLAAAGVAIDCGSVTGLAPGVSTSCTATYTVTQADGDAGAAANVAVAQGTTPTADPAAPAPVTSPPSEATMPVPAAPGLALVKTATPTDTNANGLIGQGDQIVYTFTVTNTGNQTLTGLAIDDGLLAGAGVPITCPTEPLPPLGTATCTSAPYTITVADQAAGIVHNVAFADAATPGDGKASSDPATADVPLAPPNPQLDLVKGVRDANGDHVMQEGETLHFTFLVTNTGNVTVDQVRVDDPRLRAAGLAPTCPAGALPPGASTTCVCDYTVTKADLDAGMFLNIALARADVVGGDPSTPSVDTPPSETTIPSEPLPPAPVPTPSTPAPGTPAPGTPAPPEPQAPRPPAAPQPPAQVPPTERPVEPVLARTGGDVAAGAATSALLLAVVGLALVRRRR